MEYPVDHIAVAVRSIAEALPDLERLSGGRATEPEEVPAQKVRVVFVGSGPGRLELLEPTSPDSTVARFLEKRGQGLHHVAYRVPDVAAALERLAAAGAELIDREPRPGARRTPGGFRASAQRCGCARGARGPVDPAVHEHRHQPAGLSPRPAAAW